MSPSPGETVTPMDLALTCEVLFFGVLGIAALGVILKIRANDRRI